MYRNRTDFNIANVTTGQPVIVPDGVWRTHSIFDPVTGERRSADTILNRSSENLDIRINTEVQRVLFDGDLGVSLTARYPLTETPRARCVRLASLEIVCVKEKGRIYLAAGAFHTPGLLMKSGIGPGGRNYDNPHVSSVGLSHSSLCDSDLLSSFRIFALK